MSDNELSEQPNLSFLAMGRHARAKSLEGMAATPRSQALLLHEICREGPERI